MNTTKWAQSAAKAGIQQGLHNENFELTMVDGKRTYDILFDLLDPKLVKFQFQVSTISRGYDAAGLFHEISRPLYFDARAGLVGGDQEDRGGGTGHPGLEEDLYRGENWRHQELFRGNGPGSDEGQRSLSSQSAGLRIAVTRLNR